MRCEYVHITGSQKSKEVFQDLPRDLHAVDNVSLSIEEGTTLGVVGEYGCGKSTLGRTIIHLYESTGGQILYQGKDITHVNGRSMREVRKNMQIIFQDPYSSLNPRLTVEQTIQEPMEIAHDFRKKELLEHTEQLMELVGIDQRMKKAYPHELDGGRRQRVGIARALAVNPRFIVCDEPVSALDVSIQAQILNLLKDLQKQRSLTYMFVTHDMSVVRHISDTICVMYMGQVVELAPTDELFENPCHPYTRALLSAVPSLDIHNPKKRIIMKGEVTSPVEPKPGCRLAARCGYVCNECSVEQRLVETNPKHFVACCQTAR